MWGISSRLLQQSASTAPNLGHGVSPHSRPSWPWTWGSSSLPLLYPTATAPAVQDNMEIPLKTMNKTTMWHSRPTPRRIPWGTRIEKDTCIPLFTAALFAMTRTRKQPRCPSTDEWIKKLWYIYTMDYYSAIKRNAFESVLIRWMNLEPIIQSEVSQKDKYCILMHIYRI